VKIDLSLANVDLAQLQTSLIATRLSGTIAGEVEKERQVLRGDLRQADLALAFDAVVAGRRVELRSARAQAGTGTLTGSGTLPLSSIRQISKPRDSALDGVLKGAAVGLVILAFCAPDCPGEYVVRATIGYATIGGIMDALQGNSKTMYRRDPKAAAVAWRVRF